MGPIAKALDELKFRIPMQVLQEVFKDISANWRRAPISLDEHVLNMVVRPRVLVDCNLVGGITALVTLEGIVPDYVDNYSVVYHIPKDRTQNKSIVTVMSVSYAPHAQAFMSSGMGFGAVSPQSMNDITSVGQRVMDAVSGMPPVSNAHATLIAENTVLMRDQFRVTSAYLLRCVLANDEAMNNISPRSYPAFATLVELAVKSFIYNNLIIKMDQAFLYGGQELGALKQYVESLVDAESMYQTHLREVWRPTAFANDTYSYNRFLKIQINPGL